MRRSLPRLSLALALVLSFAGSAWAACVDGPELAARAQMACCEAGHDQCPMHQSAEDCCKTDGRRAPQATTATHEAQPPLVGVPSLAAVVAEFGVAPPRSSVAATHVFTAPSPPVYILSAALLI